MKYIYAIRGYIIGLMCEVMFGSKLRRAKKRVTRADSKMRGYELKNNMMGGACGMNGGQDTCIRRSDEEIWWKETELKPQTNIVR